jgi:hypothetical protein
VLECIIHSSSYQSLLSLSLPPSQSWVPYVNGTWNGKFSPSCTERRRNEWEREREREMGEKLIMRRGRKKFMARNGACDKINLFTVCCSFCCCRCCEIQRASEDNDAQKRHTLAHTKERESKHSRGHLMPQTPCSRCCNKNYKSLCWQLWTSLLFPLIHYLNFSRALTPAIYCFSARSPRSVNN